MCVPDQTQQPVFSIRTVPGASPSTYPVQTYKAPTYDRQLASPLTPVVNPMLHNWQPAAFAPRIERAAPSLGKNQPSGYQSLQIKRNP